MAEEKQKLKAREKLVESEIPSEALSLIVASETTESELKTEQVETSQES